MSHNNLMNVFGLQILRIIVLSIANLCVIGFVVPYAWAVEIIHDSNGRVILKADSCTELQGHLEAIGKWSAARGEPTAPNTWNCHEYPQTEADITHLLPSSVKKIYGKSSICRGPNCFNSTQLDTGFLKNPRLTNQLEFSHFLTNKCKMRNSNEQPHAGDIAVIRKKSSDGSYSNEHAFTFIDKYLACSKNGMSILNPCVLESFDSVLATYGLKKQDCINHPEKIPAACDLFLNYFDCSKEESKGDDSLSSDINAFDEKISYCTVTGDLSNLSSLRKELDQLKKIPVELKDSYKNQIELLDQERVQPLNLAVRKKDFEQVKYLLAAGIDLNVLSETFLVRKAWILLR